MANKKEGPVDRRMKLLPRQRHFCPILVHRQPGAWIHSHAGGMQGVGSQLFLCSAPSPRHPRAPGTQGRRF